MNWLDCPLIEIVPGRVSGEPVIRGSRVRPQDLLNNLDLSETEIATSFKLRREDVHAVLDFFYRHEAALAQS